MKILYDNLVYCLQNFGGISTYWYELTERLLREEEVELKFYETGQEKKNILRKKIDIREEQIITSNRINLLLERFLKLPANFDSNIFHSSYFRLPVKTQGTKTVSTIHDFTHDIYYKGPRVWLHNLIKEKAINESDVIITVSNNTKIDLLRFHPHIDESKVKVVYNGVSEEFKILKGAEDINKRPFFLFIGSREHYKNFTFALEITAAYKDFDLYIVGSALSKAEEKTVNMYLNNRYKIFTGIDTYVLNDLYNQAFCLLYTSSYEGFGIPLLEAMRAGCPFIALNTSSIPEVAGEAGILINELQLHEAKGAVDEIMINKELIIEKGLLQSEKFSWNKCFNETYNIYKSLK